MRIASGFSFVLPKCRAVHVYVVTVTANVNPLNLDISVHTLHTGVDTNPVTLTRRISSLTLMTFFAC